MVVALWLSAVLSLIACVAFTPTVPTATFYLFPFRAWELFAGVLLAITGQDRAWSWSIHPALSWSGLALVAISITMLQPGAAFPGYLAMAPVAGSVLIIANGRNTNLVNRFLSSGTAVGIGLISYSLYLWHWPVLTLSRYYREDYANSFEAALWMLLAFGLAYASWRFVEQPFRKPTVRPFWQVLGAVAVCSAIAALFGAYAYLSNGAANRFRHEARLHIAASADFLQDWSRCTTASTGPLADIEVCKIGPDTLPPEVLVWGDSHARAYMDGIAQAANETNKPGLLIWHAGCPPLFELRKQESAATPAEDAACETANKKIRLAIPQLKSIKRVLLIGRWSYYQSGQGVGLDQHNQITLTPEADIQNLDADQTNLLSNTIEQTVTELRRSQKDVYIMRQPPELPAYSSRMIARKLAHGARTPKIQSAFSAPMEQLLSRSQPSDQILKTLQSSNAATVINPWPELCTKTECSVMKNGAAVYFDNNHLTNTGARMLRKLFMPFLRGDAS